MAIKLIATDLDGTLLNSENKPPREFFAWVKRHPEIRTVIASGRQYKTLEEMFSSLGSHVFYCGDNGGFIFHKGKKLYSNPIGEEDLRKAVRFMGHIPGTCLVLCGAKSAYVEPMSEEAEKGIRMFFASLTVVDDLNDVIGHDEIVKMSIYEEKGQAEEIYPLLPDLGSHIEKVLSEKRWIDIQLKSTNKGKAIRFLQEKYDISPEECMAFGDYLNDYSMMETCHFSFAMGNAHPDLKEVANFQTTSNDHMGVVTILNTMTE